MNLLYGILAYRDTMHAGHMMQTGQLVNVAAKVKTRVLTTWANSSYLPAARNQVLWSALVHQCNWALMCDADTFCVDGNAIMTMINDGIARGAAVVAAPVQLRNRHGYNVEVLRGDREIQLEREDFDGRMVEVQRIGTGFMAINCDWIRENLGYPWKSPWFDMEHVSGGELHIPPAWEGEDYRFCDKVRAAGGTVWCDGRVRAAHSNAGTAETQVLMGAGLAVAEIGDH